MESYDDRLASFCASRLKISSGSARVLDCGCGAGDVALRLARMGCFVLGLDLSLPLLLHCKRSCCSVSKYCDFVRADMRRPLACESFDMVLCLGVSFGYYSDEDNQEILSQMALALKPGGVLIIESDNPLNSSEELVEDTVELPGLGLLIMSRRFNRSQGAYEGNFHLKSPDGLELHLEKSDDSCWEERIRIYDPDEFERMLGTSGLKLQRIWGDSKLPLESYSKDSRRLVIEAVK